MKDRANENVQEALVLAVAGGSSAAGGVAARMTAPTRAMRTFIKELLSGRRQGAPASISVQAGKTVARAVAGPVRLPALHTG